MQPDGCAFRSAEVTHVAAAVPSRVAVQNLLPLAAPRRPHSVAVARYRCKVAQHQHDGRAGFRLADQTQYAAIGVIAVDPLEARRIAIQLV